MRENEWKKILKEYLGTNYLLNNLFGVLRRKKEGKRVGKKSFKENLGGKDLFLVLKRIKIEIEGKSLEENLGQIVFWIFIWCFENEKRKKN